MARPKNFPFSQFNFLVTWDQFDGTTAEAGFQEVSGLGMKIDMADYRSGNVNTDEPIRVAGVQETTHTVLKSAVVEWQR